MSTDPDDLDLPPKLAEALRDAYAHRVAIPADRERLLLSAARVHLHQRDRRRRIARWAGGLAAGLAAVLAVVVWLNRPTPTRPAVAGDLNADGKLDIVDALVLARHVQASDPTEKTWDTNRDGRVDQRDVDALAHAAVRLQQGGLTRGSLPRFDELGIDPARVGVASADGVALAPTFADAKPTRGTAAEEVRP